MSNITKKYDVDVTRVDTGRYRATNAAGASLEFGTGEGMLSPGRAVARRRSGLFGRRR